MPRATSDDDSNDVLVATRSRSASRSTTRNSGSREGSGDYASAEEGSQDALPKRPNGRGKKADIDVEPERDEREDAEAEAESEELADDEFIVEKILDHMVDQGVVKFRVKWEGYDDEEDITWEPEDTLREGAEVILEEYLASYGGIKKIISEANDVAKNKKRNRRSTGAAKVEKPPKRARKEHPLETPAPAPLREKQWKPPNGSWEDHIETIDVCDEADAETGKSRLVVYLNWKNGRKTKHNTEMVYKRCPQKTNADFPFSLPA
ncbi:Chromatin-associated protein swi6 [Ceratocystis lukuohia]|uniref:Chromatin-associated protein swi6 n=1 Tax=Ceratocystis lukuohia TaxID=2019550 RepID=A0ABR4MJF2_9PEZI